MDNKPSTIVPASGGHVLTVLAAMHKHMAAKYYIIRTPIIAWRIEGDDSYGLPVKTIPIEWQDGQPLAYQAPGGRVYNLVEDANEFASVREWSQSISTDSKFMYLGAVLEPKQRVDEVS